MFQHAKVIVSRVSVSAVVGRSSAAWRRTTVVTGHRSASSNADARPQNVGILGFEVYYPRTYVRQSDLEAHGIHGVQYNESSVAV